MPVLSISYVNYRNIKNSTINFPSREVYFVGENGQGKSNLLESIYYSAYGSSFRTRADAEVTKKGFSDFSINTLYKLENGTTEKISVIFENGKKKIDKNGKWIKDRKELINTMPCVLFCHDDMEFVTGEPERRRFFIDQCLSMYDVVYIDINRNYKKVLKSRNLCLKEKNYEMLDVFDTQLVQFGIEIEKKRRNAIFQFNQIFGKLYEKITGIDGVMIKYDPGWKTQDSLNFIPDFKQAFEILQSKREIDKAVMTTMSGPHRDRIKFIRNGSDFVSTASTGQRRLLAILLRAGQAIYYKNVTNKNPVLLMDDVLLELDPDKRQSVNQLLPEYDQLFCTFLPGEPYQRYMKEDTKVYEIKEGSWNE
jgi:DNA replication and repair protein RecF